VVAAASCWGRRDVGFQLSGIEHAGTCQRAFWAVFGPLAPWRATFFVNFALRPLYFSQPAARGVADDLLYPGWIVGIEESRTRTLLAQ
jgi:hypothetical protein